MIEEAQVISSPLATGASETANSLWHWNYCTDVSNYPSRWSRFQLNQFHQEWLHHRPFKTQYDKRRRFVFCGWKEWSWLRFTGVCLVSTTIGATSAEFWRMAGHMWRSEKLCGRPSAFNDDGKLEEMRARYLAKHQDVRRHSPMMTNCKKHETGTWPNTRTSVDIHRWWQTVRNTRQVPGQTPGRPSTFTDDGKLEETRVSYLAKHQDVRRHSPMMANWKKRDPGTWPNTRTSVRYGKPRHDGELRSSKTLGSNRECKVAGK